MDEQPEPRHFERRQPYDCLTEGHIFDKWYPHSTNTQHRTCVIPGCGRNEVRSTRGMG